MGVVIGIIIVCGILEITRLNKENKRLVGHIKDLEAMLKELEER